MSDKKISALPAATVPLAGTEVLPIVQSSTTDQVSVANLTAGRAVSALSLTSTNDSTISGATVGKGPDGGATNTVFGYQANYSSGGGARKMAIGYQAGYSNIVSNDCTFIGYQAGYSNTGYQVVAIGSGALYGVTSGAASTVAVGFKAMYASTSGTENTAIGSESMAALTTGNDNIAVGQVSFYSLTTGSNNTCVGRNGGQTLSTGSQNVYVGAATVASGAAPSNEIAIGYGAVGQGSNTAAIGNSSITAVHFPASNVVFDTAAKGINFTANTPAAGKTSQLLNWYEEGTFVPSITGSSSAGTVTLNTYICTYTRIGRLVNVQMLVQWSSGTGTGNLRIGGLPFTVDANSAYTPALTGYSTLTVPAGESLYARAEPNTTYLRCYSITNAGSTTDLAYQASGYVVLQCTYQV